ncbi:bifunctional folylpolyglutamate synthase/dihydrofolate synthase [Maribellus mangrovi]|uniref:bifunctional folylpolyglutamate synthase/dihydrofolate synthase n=1 Tax=Maribellus mangrovi TaxID=3133146 RepID=UPI0030EEFF96
MNYSDTLKYLFTRLPMFQRSGPAAYKNNLDNTLKLGELYGHPHKKYRTIHVAGTNGKGSVSHMLAAILQSAGYKVGLYTSPHLKDFRERIKINGEMIAEHDVVEWIEQYRINNELWKIEPSFFELTVALAFDYFARQEVDVAIMEVGLGGRLDSTNIVTPEVSIITNIGLDHTNLLGNTLEIIAGEKAGIIKPNVPAVIGTSQKETTPVFMHKAREENAPIHFADHEYKVTYATKGLDGKQILHVQQNEKAVLPGLKLDLLGVYQHANIPAVLKSADVLREIGFDISEQAIRIGLKEVVGLTGLLGRWQVIGNNPLVVCDTGHNEDGMRSIVGQIRTTAHKKLHIVFGTVSDKNADKLLALLPREAEYYFVRADIERGMDENELQHQANLHGLKGECYNSVNEGLKKAKENAGFHDLIFVGGSTFVVAEIL